MNKQRKKCKRCGKDMWVSIPDLSDGICMECKRRRQNKMRCKKGYEKYGVYCYDCEFLKECLEKMKTDEERGIGLGKKQAYKEIEEKLLSEGSCMYIWSHWFGEQRQEEYDELIRFIEKKLKEAST